MHRMRLLAVCSIRPGCMLWCRCRFVIGRPLVASTIVGATSAAQLAEALGAAAKGELPQDVRAEIDRIHEAYPSPNP